MNLLIPVGGRVLRRDKVLDDVELKFHIFQTFFGSLVWESSLTLNQALDQKSSNKAGIPAHSILHCYLHGLVNEDRLYSFSSSEVSFLISCFGCFECFVLQEKIANHLHMLKLGHSARIFWNPCNDLQWPMLSNHFCAKLIEQVISSKYCRQCSLKRKSKNKSIDGLSSRIKKLFRAFIRYRSSWLRNLK